MVDVEIKFDKKKLKRVQAILKEIPGAMGPVMSRGINKTATAAKTRIVRAIAAEVKVAQKAIRDRISLDRASSNRWQATLHITGKRIPLINFGANKLVSGDISYQIDPSGGRKRITYDRQTNPVFFAVMKSGHKGIFRRLGPRLPIKELMGPSIPSVYKYAEGLSARILRESSLDLGKNIDYQIALILQRRRAAA